MELYQVSVFGDKKKIDKKKPKKLARDENKELKLKIAKLYSLYETLYRYQNISILEQREVILKDNLVIYPDEMQAEPLETITLSIDENIDKKIKVAENEVKKYERLQFEFMKEIDEQTRV